MKPESQPWVTFCISTYKRAGFLKSALEQLLDQTCPDFEVVVSDNDPEESAKAVVASFQDRRLRYFPNGQNLGMIPSFNRSIDRAQTPFIVPLTDDDPVNRHFLEKMHLLVNQYKGYSLYAGFVRAGKAQAGVEAISADQFLKEILDIRKTPKILWSSAIMEKKAVLEVGKIPDYGSPHLADHALIAMTGSVRGGVIINQMFGDVTLHETNFSKTNFQFYTLACSGFFHLMANFCLEKRNSKQDMMVATDHLEKWFIAHYFNLKNYYASRKDKVRLAELTAMEHQVRSMPFMSGIRTKLWLKNRVFYLKKWIREHFTYKKQFH